MRANATTDAMTFDCHWKSIEGCALVKRLVLWNGYNVPTLLEICKRDH